MPSIVRRNNQIIKFIGRGVNARGVNEAVIGEGLQKIIVNTVRPTPDPGERILWINSIP